MDDIGDSRGTYRDEIDSIHFGSSFPLSQISLTSAPGEDELILETIAKGEGEEGCEEESTETEREEDPSPRPQHPPLVVVDRTNFQQNQSDSGGSNSGTQSMTTSLGANAKKNTLHRKPSFLGPGSHYDGGGFQFMSGLSQ
jgi:hypothetical protein